MFWSSSGPAPAGSLPTAPAGGTLRRTSLGRRDARGGPVRARRPLARARHYWLVTCSPVSPAPARVRGRWQAGPRHVKPGAVGARTGGRQPGMNIVVCVKQVPDTWAEKRLDPSDKTLDRDSADAVMNELDEYAVEEALRLKEKHGGEVIVLSMGPDKAVETIRKALSMGADRAVHLVDDALSGSDAVQTSYALAQALSTLQWDLVMLGSESTDAKMSVVPAMLAERLGRPQLSFANKVEISDGTVRIERLTDVGHDVVQGPLPAVVSVVEKINEPRYPSFKGIMAAKKKPLETLSAADAGIEPSRVGLANAPCTVEDFAVRPPRQAGTIVQDEGDGGHKLVEFLASQKFV